MKHIIAFPALLSCLAAGTALAGDVVKVNMQGEWTMPGRDAAARFYPKKAAKDRIQGLVKVDCILEANGRLSACTVTEEAPTGYGFGQATAELFVRYARVKPKSVEGGLRGGEHKKFSYRWEPM